MNEDMWLRIAREHDGIATVVDRGQGSLNNVAQDAIRYTNLSKEICHWRAVLRHSNYLKCDNPLAQNIFGEFLDQNMNNLEKSMAEMRMTQCVQLQNIRYQNLNVI